ncbi:hypothetical protein EfmE980_2466 [Enterococcus faecium E980]|nr:hypothetical protein EfmE980_2466 [Enterococcus faecium E980]MBL5002508.1 hypothetical protein [Enterococcus lactis]MBL5009994.1 hypothetical protein [Enterococcus lactis]MBL5014556.1 hypothetical protein [Enterococcus lactis]
MGKIGSFFNLFVLSASLEASDIRLAIVPYCLLLSLDDVDEIFERLLSLLLALHSL